MLLLFWITTALVIFLLVALTHILSGITDLVSGICNNNEKSVTHGVRRTVVWLLIGIAGLYAGLLLRAHIIIDTIKDILPLGS